MKVENIALLRLAQVQQELKITANQRSSMQALFDKYRSEGQEFEKKLATEKRPATDLEMRSAEKSNATFERNMLAILTNPQRKRLREISLQTAGASGLILPKIAKELKLTPVTISKLKSMYDMAMTKISAERQALYKKGQEFQMSLKGRQPSDAETKALNEESRKVLDKMESIRSDANQSMLAFLSVEQRKHWERLLGKKLGS